MSAATYSEHVVNNAKISNKTHTGDVTDNNGELTVNKIKGVDLSSFSNNSVLKVTTGGVIAAATAADYPILNQSTIGNALTATTATKATNIAGGATGSLPYQTANDSTSMLAAGASGTVLKSNGAAAPSWSSVEKSMLSTALAGEITANSNKIGNITHSGDVTDVGGVLTVNKIKNVALDSLGGGILKVAASTGIPSIATAADFPTSTVTAGGTGITSYNVGDILYADSNTTLSKLSGVATGNVLLSGGVNNGPSYGKVALSGATTHITGTLPVSSGGTGVTSLTGYVKGSGTNNFTASSTVPSTDISGTIAVANGGTGTTTSTGTGSNVLSNSPSLVSPALGTPSSGNLSNCTNVSLTTGVTGSLPVANGGTGVTTSTGSGANVLSNSPTLVSPALGTPSSGNLSNCTNVSLTTGVAGTLPVSNGGTGATTFDAGYVRSNGTTLTSVATIPASDITGLPSDLTEVDLTTDVTGILPVANGGTGGILPVANGGTGVSGFTYPGPVMYTSVGGYYYVTNDPLSNNFGGTGLYGPVRGGYYLSTIPSTTTISQQNNWTKIAGDFSGISTGVSNVSFSSGQLVCTPTPYSAIVHIIVTGSLRAATAGDNIYVGISFGGDNTGIVYESVVRLNAVSNTQSVPFFSQAFGLAESLAPLVVEVYVRNNTAARNVIFDGLTLTAVAATV